MEKDKVGITALEYMKQHPNVMIESQSIEHDTYQQKITAMVDSNSCPDLFWWNGSRATITLQNTKSLIDLTPYFDNEFKAKFADGSFNMCMTDDGRIAGFPADMELQGWIYNKALFDKYNLKIPKTFDELKECVKVFKKNNIVTIAYGSKDSWPTWGFEQWTQLWGN